MKPEYEKISDPLERSFTVKTVIRENRPLLSQAWHYHPEVEICFTEKSFGKRFVGNQISDYLEGDLVMFGSNLPHGFTTDLHCQQVVIQMTPDFLGKVFMQKPELRDIKSLFEFAKRGLVFGKSTRLEAQVQIELLKNSKGFQQMIHLFSLLDLFSRAADVRAICTKEYSLSLNATQLNRVKVVYDYILLHFKEEIKVKTVADLLNLTEVAFFKFIKKHTKKTFTEILNEFRISHATKLLISSDSSIAQICFECGYNNVSYFNRKFKAIMQQTPQEFRNHYLRKKA
ncbi:MAG: AraC family transcriptional regulator [Bacteroidia bacterium]|nr:AraC family transcriptional regulator [Bacteroidia bacterium]